MLKKIVLLILAVLVIACAAAVYLFSVNSPDEIATTAVIALEDGESLIRFVDADGKPVPGVMCNVCDDTSCTMLTSDEEGTARFAGDFVPSKVQILKVPDGFTMPDDPNFPLEAGSETVITLN